MLRHIFDTLIALTAIWLIASPYVFGYYNISTPAGVAGFLGAGVFVLALIELNRPEYWEEVAIFFLGVVLAVSPWLFRDIFYMSQTATDSIEITSGVIITCSILGMLFSKRESTHA